MTPEEILSQDQMIEFYSTHELLPYGAEEGAGCEKCKQLDCQCGEAEETLDP